MSFSINDHHFLKQSEHNSSYVSYIIQSSLLHGFLTMLSTSPDMHEDASDSISDFTQSNQNGYCIKWVRYQTKLFIKIALKTQNWIHTFFYSSFICMYGYPLVSEYTYVLGWLTSPRCRHLISHISLYGATLWVILQL